MKNWVLDRSIRYKLILLVAVSIIPLIGLQVSLLSDMKRELFEDRVLKTQHVVETAYSILDFYLKQQDQGVLTQAEAQRQAIAHIEALRYDGDQYFWINDTGPTMIMHPYTPGLNGQDLSVNRDPNGKALFVEMVNVARTDGEGLVEYQWAKPGADVPQDKVSYVKLFPAWDWVIGSGIYVDDVNTIFSGYVARFLMALVIVLAVVVAIAMLISGSVIGRSREISEFLESVSKDLNLTRRTNVTGVDELGRTGESLNHMLEAFQQSIAKVSESVTTVSSSAENLTAVAQQISDDTAKQYREIDMVAVAMEEMSTTVGEVAANVSRTAAANEEASQKSQQGHAVSQTARSAISDLATSVQAASEVVQGLERDSTNIGAILDVISGISEQTNLLALNAAIEAARAGDQGRGFAVVADEVRTLSKRTQDSVTEIEDMIRRLQEGSRSAVKVMEEGNTQASLSVEHISEVASALETISQSMGVINDMSGQIAAASEQQSAVANEISSNIAGINAAASGTSDGANRCAQSSKQLSELARDLKLATSGFTF